MLQFDDIVSGLKAVGLQKGNIVLVHSSLSKIGPLEGVDPDNRQGYLEQIYNAFSQVLDLPHGTLVVPTFTHEYVRSNTPFVYEESPSEVGMFTEYVRQRPESLRSVHPINSFAAVGSRKQTLCDNLGRACYGYDSVFDRLIRLDATMVFLGASMRHMTLKHHMEHVVGLPYTYHKAYFTPVYKGGKALSLPFLVCVRYLNGKVENNDCSKFQAHLEKQKMLRKTRIGGAPVIAVSMRDAFEEAWNLLQKDPCYFLETPYYETV